jgi:acetyl esterase/lipase
MQKILPLILLLLACSTLAVYAQVAGPAPIQPDLPDLVFADYAEPPLRLDVYIPEGDGPFPGIIVIHGGSWRRGDKSPCPWASLKQSGYVVISIQYRLIPNMIWPENLYDCLQAVKFARAQLPSRAKLDPDRLAVMGGSAGGHLALMTGLSDMADSSDSQVWKASNLGIKTVISLFGPTDLLSQAGRPELFGFFPPGAPQQQVLQGLAQASPILWVDEADPPVLMLHGTADKMVAYQQSVDLLARLEAAEVEAKLVTYEGAEHGSLDTPGVPTPTEVIVEWLDARLKPKAD